jgi:hypothetical protein
MHCDSSLLILQAPCSYRFGLYPTPRPSPVVFNSKGIFGLFQLYRASLSQIIMSLISALSIPYTTGGTVKTSTVPVGALPTQLSISASCFDNLWFANATHPGISLRLAPTQIIDCYPPLFDATPVYSPGVCPSGYTFSSNRNRVIGSTPTTFATCCPQ